MTRETKTIEIGGRSKGGKKATVEIVGAAKILRIGANYHAITPSIREDGAIYEGLMLGTYRSLGAARRRIRQLCGDVEIRLVKSVW